MSGKKDNPYDILGLRPGYSPEDAKRAYRLALRKAHPDTGGSPEQFAAVQAAWVLISKDSGEPTGSARVPPRAESSTWFHGSQPPPSSSSRRGPRTYGHPGGWFREKYSTEVRAWIGRGENTENIFDPNLIARAPRHIRHVLDAAVAEERTAVALSALGPQFAAWHDVLVSGDRGRSVSKIDHIVLGPSLLWALTSEDWDADVTVSRGEIVSDGLSPGERPVKDVVALARQLGKSLGVRFSACAYVVAGDQLAKDREYVTTRKRMPTYLVSTETVVDLLMEDTGLGTSRSLVGDDLFPVHEKLMSGIRFV